MCLEEKYGHKKRNDDKYPQGKGVKTTDAELDMFDSVENVKIEDSFVIYGDLELSDMEKEYLNLTPKYREYESLDIRKWQVEVEVHGIKTRWELMSQEKEKNRCWG